MLGIGVITLNRYEVVEETIRSIRQFTESPYTLVLADDGSADRTVRWARSEGIVTITGERRGCAWNKNRVLYYLMEHSGCDPILLLEDDTVPCSYGWEDRWCRAARKWFHVNIRCDDEGPAEYGDGTPDNPYACRGFGGQCSIITRSAIKAVGYLNTRFLGYGWEHVEWTHRFRMHYDRVWSLPSHAVPCLSEDGLRVTWPDTFWSEREVNQNWRTYASLMTGPIFAPPFQNRNECDMLMAEITEALLHGG